MSQQPSTAQLVPASPSINYGALAREILSSQLDQLQKKELLKSQKFKGKLPKAKSIPERLSYIPIMGKKVIPKIHNLKPRYSDDVNKFASLLDELHKQQQKQEEQKLLNMTLKDIIKNEKYRKRVIPILLMKAKRTLKLSKPSTKPESLFGKDVNQIIQELQKVEDDPFKSKFVGIVREARKKQT